MTAPTSLSAARTGTPDGTDGLQLAELPSQEDSNKIIVGGVSLSDRIAAGLSADRAGLSSDDTGTTDMSTTAFAGGSGANLIATNNRGALIVWCEFANAAGSAIVEIVFYDSSNNPLFVSEQLTFGAKTQRKAAAGDYLSQAQVIDTYGASKYRPFLRSKGTGDVDIYAQPV